MPVLKKKEIFRRPNSDLSEVEAIKWTQNWLDNFQKNAPKDDNGEYKVLYFGDLFNAENGRVFRIFSTACGEKYNIPKDKATSCYSFNLIDIVTIKSAISENANKIAENAKAINELKDEVENNNTTTSNEVEVI